MAPLSSFLEGKGRGGGQQGATQKLFTWDYSPWETGVCSVKIPENCLSDTIHRSGWLVSVVIDDRSLEGWLVSRVEEIEVEERIDSLDELGLVSVRQKLDETGGIVRSPKTVLPGPERREAKKSC